MDQETNAARNVTASIIGRDVEVAIINGKTYVIKPPTIKRLSGAIHALTAIDMSDAPTLREMLFAHKDADAYAKALSWLVRGNGSLAGELSNAPVDEVIEAVLTGINMTGQSFMKAVGLLRCARRLAARDHQ